VTRKGPSIHRKLRDFALKFPDAYEDFPWGEVVVKVNKKVFVFLGLSDASPPEPGSHPTMSVKLAESHDEALSFPGAAPTGHGLGKSGWVSIPIGEDAPPVEVLSDFIEESYRIVAPKRLVKALDAAAAE
jgi:predicted DNA-binding protein (MmcQ/YjbR family)